MARLTRSAPYLDHFWTHWSGPDFNIETPEFDALVDRYARPGAFQAATNWYRVGAGYAANALNERPPAQAKRLSTPTHVLWQELDPLFPRSWADRIEEFFSDITIHHVDGVGHFTPLEAPRAFADTITAALNRTDPAGRVQYGSGRPTCSSSERGLGAVGGRRLDPVRSQAEGAVRVVSRELPDSAAPQSAVSASAGRFVQPR